MLTALLLLVAGVALPGATLARTLEARVERVESAVAGLSGVRMRLDWPAGAREGRLRLSAASLQAPGLGYAFRDVTWDCLARRDGAGGWSCDGPVRAAGAEPVRLSVALGSRRTVARLSGKGGAIDLRRLEASPDLTAIDIAGVPATWAQALVTQAWAAPTIGGGRLDARLQVVSEPGAMMQVEGDVAVQGLAFDTPDARIAAEGLSGEFAVDWRKAGDRTSVLLDGSLHGGEVLAGKAYLDLEAPVAVRVEALGHAGAGWRLPSFTWNDPGVLQVSGSAAFSADAALRDLRLEARSRDAAPLARRYLTGWLAPLGLGNLQASGAADLDVSVAGGSLHGATLRLHDIDLADAGDPGEAGTEAAGRFALQGLDGDVRFSRSGDVVASSLRWASGSLYGLPFGATVLALESGEGDLRLREPATVPAFGGVLRLDTLSLRPPAGGVPFRARFGLALDALDIGRLSEALGWPEFRGTLSGRIPDARYADDRLEFDGGLTLSLFEGHVGVTDLSMERPFGSAPSLSADIAIDGLDLEALTGVFGFGSISGRLDGRIDDLRLVDWQPTAFDARLYTDREPGVRQRISQRAVQNISSVGDASFATSLQGRLIGIFDDFGYSAIGISCRLRNEVCEMGGLRSGADTFTIVSGAGLPHLTVVGHNRLVDWPVLVERLAAVGKGEVKPVFD